MCLLENSDTSHSTAVRGALPADTDSSTKMQVMQVSVRIYFKNTQNINFYIKMW